MRPRIDGPLGQASAPNITLRYGRERLRDAPGVAELFTGVFRRDLLNFFPQTQIEALGEPDLLGDWDDGPRFHLSEGPGDGSMVAGMFGVRYRLTPRGRAAFTAQDRRLI